MEAQKRIKANEDKLMKMANQGRTAEFYKNMSHPLQPAIEMRKSSSEAEKSDNLKDEGVDSDVGKMSYAGDCLPE